MNPPTDCPRCGQTAVAEPACPRCGIILAKARANADRRRSVAPAPNPAPAHAGLGSLALMVAAAAAAAMAGSRAWDRIRPAAATPAHAHVEQPAHAPAREAVPPPTLAASLDAPIERVHVETVQAPDADRARASDLARRTANPSSLTAADVQSAEQLLFRHPDERPLRDLLEVVLLGAASRHEHERQFPQALTYLQRAQQVQPSSTRAPLGLLQLAFETADWAAAEAAARAVVALEPRSFDGWQGLGFALVREDRSGDAVEALRTALDIREDGNTRAVMERLQKGLADERGMAERHISHFNVRYDGEAHEGVGREVVLALEHHYATLASTLDFEPGNTIPVILFTREEYNQAGGSSQYLGHYDGIDGRIRMPVGGFRSGLTAEMEATLLHELTHAFINERTRGAAQRFPMQEGLAQYIEGKRTETTMDPRWITALADGRLGGEWGLYIASLSFVEYLMAQRGQGGMNELLKVAGETGSMDEAFQQVYGTTLHGALQTWSDRLRQQHGSL